MNKNDKIRAFEKVLELEHLAEAKTFDGRNYFEQADGAFKVLEALGLGGEYIEWAFNK